MSSEQPGMSGRRGVHPDVDLDLLADYASGVLEGTPESARVAELVDTSPAWAELLDQLRSADRMVSADLARMAELPLAPMPEDIAARLDQALVDAGGSGSAVTDRPVDLDTVRIRRRRRYRIAAVAAVAAGFLAFAVPVGQVLFGQSDADEATVSRSPGAAPEALESAPGAPGDRRDQRGVTGLGRDDPVPIAVSGTEYLRDTVHRVREQRRQATLAAPTQVPGELSRLAGLEALEDCLAAIRSTYPGSVAIVDFARFEDDPALVVAIDLTGSGSRVVVVGPECGLSGADQLYTTTV